MKADAATHVWLHTLLCSIRNTGIILTDWRQGVVVPNWKGNGETQECINYIGLSVRSKVLARVSLDRVCQKLLIHQCHGHSDFTPYKSTVDRILALCPH